MKRVFVDTSGWFAYARKDDPAHEGAREALERWEGRLVTTDYIFDETVTLTRARLGPAAAVKLGETLLDPGVVELAPLLPEDFEDAWELFKKRKDKGWSFTDCTSFAVMRRLRLHAAVATDRHFHQAGFSALPG
ncbi:MAG TPA: type II toxin-antitoxin system VapC family toxin [Elusimicrobiota bacterium]|nr:type II toxin-antitoxin system VapC family toxin [Elusimicrobiota bacterium]